MFELEFTFSLLQIQSSVPLKDRFNHKGIAYMGHYNSGRPTGKFWLGLVGDGFIHGDTRPDGQYLKKLVVCAVAMPGVHSYHLIIFRSYYG